MRTYCGKVTGLSEYWVYQNPGTPDPLPGLQEDQKASRTAGRKLSVVNWLVGLLFIIMKFRNKSATLGVCRKPLQLMDLLPHRPMERHWELSVSVSPTV